MKNQFAISELMELGLDVLPKSRRSLELYVKSQGWQFVEVPSRGAGGMRKEYFLPTEIAHCIKQQLIQQAADAAPALPVVAIDQTQPPAVVAPSQLADWQRQCAEARLVLVREVQQRMKAGGKKTAALQSVVDDAAAGALAAHLQGFVSIANARAGDDRAISRRSLFEWVGLVEQAEQQKQSAVALLAPKPRAQKIPAWAGALLKVWGQPQKPNLPAVLDMLPQVLPAGVECPSYSQAYRFLSEKVGNVEREKGRLGSRSLKNIQPFIRRDTTILQPSDVYTADGHCFDAEVAHPDHGRPFRPEITAVVDVATRVMVGWSLDLAESGWAVLDAIRMSATRYGVPAVFYVDNGSGYKNDLMKNEGLGLLARLGTSIEHSLPYNSQARGIIERSHQSVWVKAAKNLPTYMGKDMDDQAKQQAFKVTRKQITQFGQSNLMLQWSEFVQVAERVVAEYNNKPHRSLGTIVDPVTLKRRHMTPLEAWNLAVQQGAELVTLDEVEQQDLFRPYVMRQVSRGEIKLRGNIYFARELEQFHGELVAVGYEIENAEQVWVRNADGYLIAIAKWNANKRNYFPLSVIEQSKQKRAEGRLRRLAVKQAEVLEELSPKRVIEHVNDQTALPSDLAGRRADLADVFAEMDALPVATPEPTRFEQMRPRQLQVLEGGAAVLSADEQKLARWQALDDVWLSTGVIEKPEDYSFWNLFQKSKTFKAMLAENEELARRMESTAYAKRELF